MSAFDKFVNFLQTEMTTPAMFSPFHIACLVVVIALCVGFGFWFRNASKKKVKIFLIVISSIMLVFELYKQLVFSYSFGGDAGGWDYQWYVFPFQFCSTPMYIALIAGLIKEGKFQDSLFSFLGTFSLFAGLSVMIMPSDVFMCFVGINIQTVVVHGGMVLIAVVLYASKSIKLEHKTILKALYVFLVLVGIALLGNCIYHWCGGTETCNLFFISPYFPCSLPVFNIIYTKVPYIVFLMLYVVAFTFIAYVMLLLAMLFNKLVSKRKRKTEQSNN